MKTIGSRFLATAQQHAKRTALKFKDHGRYGKISFAEFEQRVRVTARALRAAGVRKGDRVGILSENRPAWMAFDLASALLGAITVPIHTTVSAAIIKHIIADAGIKVLFVSRQDLFNKLLLVANELPSIELVVYAEFDQESVVQIPLKVMSYKEFKETGRQTDEPIVDQAQEDDVATLVYTSGTTALPKGVMLTHGNIMFDAEAAVTVVPVTHQDTLLSFLPLSHVLERTAGYYAPLVCRGATIAFAESIKALPFNLKQIKPTVMISVPRVFEKMHRTVWEKVKEKGGFAYKLFIWALKTEPDTFQNWIADRLVFRKIRATLGGHLRFTISGGASLNEKLARFFNRIGIIILEGYGLTETSPVTSVNRLDAMKFGTVGQHLPGVEVQIAQDKEIIIRGPHVMRGYYNQPELTKEAIDNDGWFHSGDLGFIDQDGFLTVIGRKKEMIALSNGKIAWPEQIELLLNNDRLIYQSLVYGNKRSYLTALLVPDWVEVKRELEKHGITQTEPDELLQLPSFTKLYQQRLDKINEQLADWEKIRGFVLLADGFSEKRDELTPTLKLRRDTIIHNHKQQLEQLYS